MVQKCAVRKGRPYKEKLSPYQPMITDKSDRSFSQLLKVELLQFRTFGSGKTVVQHQLAKWADADIIVYVGCGERGNEMTDVLNEFPNLKIKDRAIINAKNGIDSKYF